MFNKVTGYWQYLVRSSLVCPRWKLNLTSADSLTTVWDFSRTKNIVQPPCATTSRKRPPPISDHLSKHQIVPVEVTRSRRSDSRARRFRPLSHPLAFLSAHIFLRLPPGTGCSRSLTVGSSPKRSPPVSVSLLAV